MRVLCSMATVADPSTKVIFIITVVAFFFFLIAFVFKQVSDEMKTKSLEAKARGDDAFKKKEYMLAIDAYTQVLLTAVHAFYSYSA